ncbi:hypothetical protein CH063_01745, partial [Colletotrichum higginsianum]
PCPPTYNLLLPSLSTKVAPIPTFRNYDYEILPCLVSPGRSFSLSCLPSTRRLGWAQRLSCNIRFGLHLVHHSPLGLKNLLLLPVQYFSTSSSITHAHHFHPPNLPKFVPTTSRPNPAPFLYHNALNTSRWSFRQPSSPITRLPCICWLSACVVDASSFDRMRHYLACHH